MSSTDKAKTKGTLKTGGPVHNPIVLKHKHTGFNVMDCLGAALKIALKEPNSALISKSDSLIVVQKSREVAAFISKILRLPRSVVYEEKWKLETDAEVPRFLITSTINIGRYGLTVGSQFKQVKDIFSNKTIVDICSKVVVRGLDKDAVMYRLVKNYIRCEFAAQRRKEKRTMKRTNKNKAKARDYGKDANHDEDTEPAEEESDLETVEMDSYNVEVEALMKEAQSLIASNGSGVCTNDCV